MAKLTTKPVASRRRGSVHVEREGQLSTLLARLKAGPLSTYEAELNWYRGQATVGELRTSGHVIETVAIEGRSHYVYRGYARRVKVSTTMQDAYYTTRHWRSTSKKRKRLDGFTCRQCGSRSELETHHWTYLLFAEDIMEHLATYCRTCHEAIHTYVAGSSCHFPRYVTEEIAERIRRESRIPIAA